MKKLISAGVAVAVVVAAAYLVFGRDGPKPVVHGLNERDANEILVILGQKGIAAEKREEASGRVTTWRVDVGDDDDAEALRVLVANHLPRPAPASLSTVYREEGAGLIPTRSEEKARFMMALQGEIESKLMTLPGIVSAHVTVVQPERDILHVDVDQPVPSSASVALVYNAADERGGKPQLAPGQNIELEIPALVAAAVEGLRPENVHVTWARNTAARADAIATTEPAPASSSASAPSTAMRRFGLRLADRRSADKLEIYGALTLLAALLGVGVGAGGVARAAGLRRRLGVAEARVASMSKAGRAAPQVTQVTQSHTADG